LEIAEKEAIMGTWTQLDHVTGILTKGVVIWLRIEFIGGRWKNVTILLNQGIWWPYE